MASVFAGGQTHKGSFRADQLQLLFDGDNVRGWLVQNIQFSYTQQVTLLYEVGSEFVYYVGGRAQGTASLARVIGPSSNTADLINKYNDICQPQPITMSASAGCPGADGVSRGGMEYTLEDAVLVSIAVTVTAQDVVITEQLQFIFVDLESPGISSDG